MAARVIAGLAVGLFALTTAHAQGTAAHTKRAEWMYQAKWGVFTHYLAGLQDPSVATVEAWNKSVDSFDVEALAEQVASTGAKYYIITLGQNSGFYCSPNAAYDKLVGISPSKCSKRDLVADLYAPLHKRGVTLMVYLPSGAPDKDPEAMKALEWKNNPQPSDPDPRLKAFQQKWESVIREWSLRWGKKVAGWWFDGCYFADAMYRSPDAPNFKSLADAARAGNADSAVAFNPGVLTPIITHSEFEDYTAGEINDPATAVCPGRWIGQAQSQMLSYLGKWWGGEPARFTTEQAVAYTQAFVEKGGVVTWDVPVSTTGRIPEVFLEQLKAVGKAVAAVER